MREKRLAGKNFFGRLKTGALMLFFVIGLWLSFESRAFGAVLYTNPDTDYVVVLEDDADLLDDEEEAELMEKMQEITRWGSAAFKSIDENVTSTERYIESYYREIFGRETGTAFLIDMDNRNIWLKNNGQISRIITNSYSDTITDNSYRYASRGDYFGCAMEVFDEIETLLSGSRIAQPMEYVSKAGLAAGIAHRYSLTNPQATFLKQTKHYDPVSSDSGGSDSGSSGGGGGGSSGSGGGHSF